jgi:hypothetical protein
VSKCTQQSKECIIWLLKDVIVLENPKYSRKVSCSLSLLFVASLLSGVARDAEHTALALGSKSTATTEEDVPGHAPAGSPAVLHLPEVLPLEGTVAHSEHTVVQAVPAGSIHHTATVELEAHLVSLDGDGDWLLGHSSHHSGLGVSGDVRVAGDCGNVLARGSLARAISCSVRVLALRAEAPVLDDVLESTVHDATVASLVALRATAVHKLLLREVRECARLKGSVEKKA